MRTLWVMGAAAFVLALGVPLGAAKANVSYEFQQTVSNTLDFDATLIVPNFITANTTFPIADFTVTNNSTGFTSVEFSPDTGGICPLFGLSTPCDIVTLTAGGTGSAYLFPLGTLGETGTSVATLGAFSGTSTINEVPEPASLALLGAGIAALGSIRRRRNPYGDNHTHRLTMLPSDMRASVVNETTTHRL